ncbi:hypothetical protein [Paenibacillus antarcticus]|uniref:Uncharacterized protein n=1 Tax=Paenibacillus antarcticus TaxID=253703 RepID=A0A168KAT2_9BACL|nr:hypothetical protein [Paenibacillus antarcticus]OAB41781.1 hypothetical protein PBAT_20565 [Paenibacillus antarcticus]
MLALITKNKNINRHKVVSTIGTEEKNIALEKFKIYQNDGVIQTEFNDDAWILSDEKDLVTLDFSFDEVYVKKYMNHYSVTEFKEVFKCYISFCLGQYIIGTLQELVFNIKELLYNTECLTKIPKKRNLLFKTGIQDFIELMPFASEDILLEEERYKYNYVKRRELAEYQSYFLFGRLLEEYWKSNATNDNKVFFYPIYLWWNITMILPVRVTEFTLTPKECVVGENGVQYFKIRRSKMKGNASRNRNITYKINEDYKIYDYAVSNEIAAMILDYKKLVKGYKESNIDSLFVNEVYVNANNKLKDYGFFHTKHFSRLLDVFYCDVIEKDYNYRVIPKDKLKETNFVGEVYKLKVNEIVKISLGDSRHIAMQNMLLNGANILMAKEITGHENVDMIFHYSGNMKNLIRCKAYSLFELSKRKEIILESVTGNGQDFILRGGELTKSVEVDQGKCFSPLFTQGNMEDCYAVAGICEICNYFQGNKNRKELIKKQELKVEEKLKRLKRWISSEKEYRNTDEYVILKNQLKASVENLLNAYVEELVERGTT